MRNFFKFIVGLLTVPSFVVFILLTTVHYQLTNPKFLTETLDKTRIYENIQRAIRAAIKEQYEEELKKEGRELESLTVNERAYFEQQVDAVTEKISQKRIKDFSETNIERVFAYYRGQSPDLLLYFPLEEWGVESVGDDLSFLSEETNVDQLIQTDTDKQRYRQIHNFDERVRMAWYASVSIIAFLVLLHYLLSDAKSKVISQGKLLVISGVIIFVLGQSLKLVGLRLERSLPYMRKSLQLFAGSVGPALISEITTLWFAVASLLFLVGIAAISIKSYLEKKRQDKRLKTASKR
jgi:hypothetical protein